VATSKDVENQKMLETVSTEEIGTLKILQEIEASQSVADGKGIPEKIVAVKVALGLGLGLGLVLGGLVLLLGIEVRVRR